LNSFSHAFDYSSAKYFSPQQKVLPRNQIKGKRKPGIKLKLTKVRGACGDQLVPFEGLWGYTQDLDYYPGTIFRFPLRTAEDSAGSTLWNSKKVLKAIEACRLLETYFDEARISLLFLRRIKSIDFKVQGDPNIGWSVTRLQSLHEDVDLFSKSVTCQFTKRQSFISPITGEDRWLVAVEDLVPEASLLQVHSRRAMKNVECGIAALISSTFDNRKFDINPPKAVESRIFNTLPLPFSSDLPVHIHATFLLSGDRQSIAIEEHGMNSREAEWNRHLLQEQLPKLYLSFLDYIAPQVRQRVFGFWPQQEAPRRSCAELLCASFWKELPQSSRRLFPKAQPILQVSHRRPPESLEFSQAVFDFLPKTQSEALAPLLLAMQVNLVRDVPRELARRLGTLPGVKSVTGPLLRALFKSEQSRTCLLREVAKTQQRPRILEVLFGLMIPLSTEQLPELDGCHILPLANGSIATLKYEDTNEGQSSHYSVVTEDELKLFEFASSLLVTSSVGNMFNRISESEKNFNLVKLKLSGAKKLLEIKPVVSTPDADEDKWLLKFWKYWNSSIDATLPAADINTVSAKIFKGTVNATPFYASPATFRTVPAVVEPDNGENKQLCEKIPGLWCFDNKFMPKALVESEKSLYSEASFSRFIRALRQLSVHNGIANFVKTHLSASDLKVSFSNIFIEYM
jgi:sacsin